jgi:hypothetical protein
MEAYIAVRSNELAVGVRARSDAGLAIVASGALVAVFAAFTWLSKETPALYLHQPWQDDPYDVVVSLDFIILPLLLAAGAVRVHLCRRYRALPARRLVDLIRLCRAAVGVSMATELAEWVAVALGRHSEAWTAVTAWQLAVLAVLTVAMIGGCVLLRHAAHAVSRVARSSAQPDWLTDAVTLGMRASRVLRRQRHRSQAAVRWANVQVIARVRRHPIAAAALLAAALALPYVAIKIVLEDYPPGYVLLSFAAHSGTR